MACQFGSLQLKQDNRPSNISQRQVTKLKEATLLLLKQQDANFISKKNVMNPAIKKKIKNMELQVPPTNDSASINLQQLRQYVTDLPDLWKQRRVEEQSLVVRMWWDGLNSPAIMLLIFCSFLKGDKLLSVTMIFQSRSYEYQFQVWNQMGKVVSEKQYSEGDLLLVGFTKELSVYSQTFKPLNVFMHSPLQLNMTFIALNRLLKVKDPPIVYVVFKGRHSQFFEPHQVSLELTLLSTEKCLGVHFSKVMYSNVYYLFGSLNGPSTWLIQAFIVTLETFFPGFPP